MFSGLLVGSVAMVTSCHTTYKQTKDLVISQLTSRSTYYLSIDLRLWFYLRLTVVDTTVFYKTIDCYQSVNIASDVLVLFTTLKGPVDLQNMILE